MFTLQMYCNFYIKKTSFSHFIIKHTKADIKRLKLITNHVINNLYK